MNSKNDSEQSQKGHLTLKIKYSSGNIAIAKVVIITIVSILFAQYFVTQSREEYRRGQEITQEEYIENFTQYRAELLKSRTYASNYPFAVFIFFIVLGFIFGSYELISFAISLAIGKIIPQDFSGKNEE